MELRVRPWLEDDIANIVRYWKTLSNADAERMGWSATRNMSAHPLFANERVALRKGA